MKVAVIQPYYSFEPEDAESCYEGMLALMDKCDESLDLIVLPEYSDVPSAQEGKEGFHKSIKLRNKDILERSASLAKRCSSLVFVNCADGTESGYRNTTHVIDKNGQVIAKYYKAHPAPSEVKTEKEGGNELDVSYSYEFSEPFVFEYEGIRYGFMTCYDFYFYENYARLARERVDVIIGCSHQRTDTQEALSIINRFLSYHTNAYLIRASISLGEESGICGGSTVIAPDGSVLFDMKSRIGIETAEIDPTKKFYKPAGFRGAPKAHYEYIEDGRRPWLYRNGGPSVGLPDRLMPYPRLSARGGLSRNIPEDLMAAIGAAVGIGASEIALELFFNSENIPFCRGINRENVKLDKILAKFSARAILSLTLRDPLTEERINVLKSLVHKYDAEGYVTLTVADAASLRELLSSAPKLPASLTVRSEDELNLALLSGCNKIFLEEITEELLTGAHSRNLRVTTEESDPKKAKALLALGVDTVITDDYMRMK